MSHHHTQAVLNLLKVAAAAALKHADLSQALAGGGGGVSGGGVVGGAALGTDAGLGKDAVRCLRRCYHFFLGGGAPGRGGGKKGGAQKGGAPLGKVMDLCFRVQVCVLCFFWGGVGGEEGSCLPPSGLSVCVCVVW